MEVSKEKSMKKIGRPNEMALVALTWNDSKGLAFFLGLSLPQEEWDVETEFSKTSFLFSYPEKKSHIVIAHSHRLVIVAKHVTLVLGHYDRLYSSAVYTFSFGVRGHNVWSQQSTNPKVFYPKTTISGRYRNQLTDMWWIARDDYVLKQLQGFVCSFFFFFAL